MKNKRVLLGMSGGIDSTMSVLFLQEMGYKVIGATLLTWGDDTHKPAFLTEASHLAQKLGINHVVHDIRKSFKTKVVSEFVNAYARGETPSPCPRCNETIKWPELMKLADQHDCMYVATGHYVRKTIRNNLYYIQQGIDPVKDQSYFLWRLNQEMLQRSIFPLGDKTKDEVRKKARENNLPKLTGKKESMGVCFLQDTNYREFLMHEAPEIYENIPSGNVVDTDGNIIGSHKGYPFYTSAQKKGFLCKQQGLVVRYTNPQENTITVDKTENLMARNICLKNTLFTNRSDVEAENIRAMVRGIGVNPDDYCQITLKKNNTCEVKLEQSAWALTPGQPVVFYQDDLVLGGGVVERFW